MKIKQDFITNSSSTAFFFIFKGKRKKQLFEVIRNHWRSFNLKHVWGYEYKSWSCKVENIIEGITLALKKRSKWDECKIKPVRQLIIDIQEQIDYFNTEINNPENEDWLIKIYKRDIKVQEKRLKEVQDAIDNGFINYLEIEFGDNDGHCCGGATGAFALMDYKKPKIKADDLILMNESRH